MLDLQNENATANGGISSDVVGGQASTKQKKEALLCDSNHITNIIREIGNAGLRLHSTSGDTQLTTLPKVLAYFGARGANTYELVALGYLRAATRLKELQETYQIVSLRENVIGPDGLHHINVARYFLLGKRKDLAPAQATLPGVA